MQHISETQLKSFQVQLSESLEKLRLGMTEILMRSSHASHKLAAKQLQKFASDELLELALKINIPSIAHKIEKMESIDAALHNIEMDMYGLCSDCENEIRIERLKIDPTIQRCLSCQEKYDKQRNNSFKL